MFCIFTKVINYCKTMKDKKNAIVKDCLKD